MTRVHNQEAPVQEPSDIAVDRWVHLELSRTYDVVLGEEVPEEWIRLLGSFETTHTSSF